MTGRVCGAGLARSSISLPCYAHTLRFVLPLTTQSFPASGTQAKQFTIPNLCPTKVRSNLVVATR